MKLAVYPGEFDPLTNYQLDIALRAARLFERLVIAPVGGASNTELLFSLEERIAMLKAVLPTSSNIEVIGFNGSLASFAYAIDAQVIIRSLGGSHKDELRGFGNSIIPTAPLETCYLAAAPRFSYINSSLIKEIAAAGGDVSELVPPVVAKRLYSVFGLSRK